MAWVTVATTNLGDSSATYGYVYLQYDNSSTGTSRTSRLRFELRSGYSVYVYIDNLSLDGSVVRSRFTCSGTMDFWTGSLAAGTRKFTWSCPWYSGTRSYTCSGNIPSGVTPPSGLSATLNSKTYNSATIKVSLSSYGVPSSTDGRYIEAAVLNQNSYGASYRFAIARNTTSSTITVNNSSSANPSSFNIEANHKYWYGAYASNTQANTSTVTGSFYTPCPPLATLTFASQAYSTYNTVNATINYTRQTDAGAETRTGYYRYSTDGGNTYSSWTSFGTINVAVGSTASFIANVPTASNITLQAKINTPNGGDSTTKTVTFSTLETHTAPNFSNFEYADNNSSTVALTGNNQTMIQGQSVPRITISAANKATGNNGISVSNYAISFTGQSKTVAYSSSSAVTTNLDPPSESGTGNLVVSAVDSLSLSKAVTKSVTIYPWSKPTISATIERVNNFETTSKINASGIYSPILINGVVKNTLSFEYRTKKSSSSDWSAWTSRSVTISGSNWSISNLSVSLDNNYQWDVQTRIVDIFTSTTIDLSLPVGMPNFFIGADGRVSVGMKPGKTLPSGNRGQLEVDGMIYSKNQPVMASHVGQIIMSITLDTAAKVQAIYGGTWVSWGAGRVPVGVGSNGTTNYTSANATGGAESHRHDFCIGMHAYYGALVDDDWVQGVNGSGAYSYSKGTFSKSLNWSGGATTKRNNSLGSAMTTYTETCRRSYGDTDVADSRQPYITCYMWRRTA
jgi:hypothetical protein